MKIPSLSLYQSLPRFSSDREAAYKNDLDLKVKQFAKAAPKLGRALKLIPANLRYAIIDSAFPDAIETAALQTTIDNVSKTIVELTSSAKVVTVGIWDLDATIGDLPRLVTELTEAQSQFAVFHIHASIPSGLLSRNSALGLGEGQSSSEPSNNILADRFFPIAEKVRKDFGLDLLVGISHRMIAFFEDGRLHQNYFSVPEGKQIIVSSFGMREYARVARRPFRAAVGSLIVSQLLIATNKQMGFHDETKGCLFDFNESRDSIVKSLQEFKLDEDCMNLVSAKYRQSTANFMKALNSMKD